MRTRTDSGAGKDRSAKKNKKNRQDEADGHDVVAQLCKALARMAAVGAPIVAALIRRPSLTQDGALANHSAEPSDVEAHTTLRDALTAAGFEIANQSGDNHLMGRFAPRWRVRRHPPPPALVKVIDKSALVIGAGLAGCHIVERLAAKGWQVTLIDRADRPASGASGNPAGVFHPMITADEGLAARLSRSGFVHALSRWRALERAGHPLRWSQTGLLQLGLKLQDNEGDEAELGEGEGPSPHASAPGLPQSMVEEVDALTAKALAGISSGAYPTANWLFKQGGWIDPVSLCQALLAASRARLTCHFGQVVENLERRNDQWHALDRTGQSIASASVVVMANAFDAQRLARLQHVNIDNIRGQLTFLPPDVFPDLARPLMGNGYLSPAPGGAITGASYGVGDMRTELDPREHRDNLDRLAGLLGVAKDAPAPFGLDMSTLRGRVAFRCTSRDRLPMIGLLGDERLTAERAGSLTGAHALDLPRCNGLYGAFGYGSRGLIWAALAAELLLSQIEHTPPPLETDLIDAIDPARFLLRDVRRGKVR